MNTSPSLLPSGKTTLLSKVTALPEIKSDNSEASEGRNALKDFCTCTPKSMGFSTALALAPRRGYAETS